MRPSLLMQMRPRLHDASNVMELLEASWRLQVGVTEETSAPLSAQTDAAEAASPVSPLPQRPPLPCTHGGSSSEVP